MTSTAALEILLGLLLLHFVVEIVKASACRLSYRYEAGQGIGNRKCPDPNLANVNGSCLQMGQDKMQPKTALGSPFNVEILLCEHWLSTRPTALQSAWLIRHTDWSRTAGGSRQVY
jgi:hypothetical protein